MTPIFIIIGSILILVILVVLLMIYRKKSAVNVPTPPEPVLPKTQKQEMEDMYKVLRDLAFSATPEKLGLPLRAGETVVFGIIMDWEMDGDIATTVIYQTGDASMYYSPGGGIIGGGGHQSIKTAVKRCVSLAQTYLDKATRTETSPLPGTDTVKFYLKTNKGLFVGQEHMSNFENSTSPWMGLFEEINGVIAELRMTQEQQ